jgi:hypothetical protein
MNLNAYRRNWLKYQRAYEIKSYKIIRKAFIDMANDIPYDKLTPSTYEMHIEFAVSNKAMLDAYTEIYATIGIAHGTRIGKLINNETKDFIQDIFSLNYRSGLSQWILENAGLRITSVRANYIQYIKELISNGLLQEKTIREIAKEIQELVKRPDFYRWQGLRIARTETTGAANRGAVIAGNSSGIVYDKIWLSADDPRVRTRPESNYDHRAMDGVKVGKDEPFNVNGELIMYAGAMETVYGTQSNPQNIINCRCTNALVPRRDANGRLVRI